jgi:hypothetical protein
MAAQTALAWWQWGAVQRRLALWTKALLRGRVYSVVLDPSATLTGFCDLRGRRIVANPESFGDGPAEQWTATKGLLAHEAGHALFTDAWPDGEEQQLLRQVVNSLEDERVERGVGRLYPGVAGEIRFRGDLRWADCRERLAGEPPADTAGRILAACLAWRWARTRGGHAALAGALGLEGDDERLWLEQVRPLVEASWEAESTHRVIAAARQILELLDLPEGWALPERLVAMVHGDLPDGRDGEPLPLPAPVEPAPLGSEGDEGDGGDEEEGEAEGEGIPSSAEPESPPLPAGGDEPPLTEEERKYPRLATRVPPAPYLDLEAAAQPLRARWVAELRPDRREMPHTWRGRYSFRQEARDPERPFLLGQARAPSAEGLAIQVLVDRSSSMRERIPDVRLALMALHLACEDLGVPLAITVFGGEELGGHERPGITFTVEEFGEHGELPEARIAGLMAPNNREFLYSALTERGPVLEARPEEVRLLLVVHDGYPVYQDYPAGTDYDLSRAWLVEAERRGLLPIGVLLVEELDDPYVEQACGFFPGRLIVCRAEELPGRFGNLLRCFV